MPSNFTRRHFLGGAVAAATACQAPTEENVQSAPEPGILPSRPLGSTGSHPSILGMGCGSRLGMYEEEDRAIEALNLALDLGVTYLDTAQSYGGGNSEKWVGKVMAHRRDQVFLATKIRVRGYEEAMSATETSLKRLQTDQIDLIHIHSLQDEDDLAAIEAGSLKALMELRDQGVCRFAGITSHTHPDVLATALDRHDFDCTQMALNAARQGRSANARDPVDTPPVDSFEAVAMPVAVRKKMGILAMKVTGQESLVGDGPGKSGIGPLMRYALSLPVTAAVVGMPKLDFIRENVEVARNFEPMPASEMESYSQQMSDLNKRAMDAHFCCHVDA